MTEFRLIAKDTIEEKILKLQESKQNLADSLIQGTGESLMTMSAEELIELLDDKIMLENRHERPHPINKE